MNKLIAIVFLVLAISHFAYTNPRPTFFCSIKLNEILSTLCGEKGFNKLIMGKRSNLDLIDNLGSENPLMPNPLEHALLDLYEGGINSLTQTKRTRRGIVDECCKNTCTYPELMSYCYAP